MAMKRKMYDELPYVQIQRNRNTISFIYFYNIVGVLPPLLRCAVTAMRQTFAFFIHFWAKHRAWMMLLSNYDNIV